MPRRRPLPDHEVELEVLHRRIERLLDDAVQAMDLVDEEHVAALEVGEDRREVARPLEHRTRGAANGDAHLVRDDVRERRLAETGRAVEQHVVEHVAARARGRDRTRGSPSRAPGRRTRRARGRSERRRPRSSSSAAGAERSRTRADARHRRRAPQRFPDEVLERLRPAPSRLRRRAPPRPLVAQVDERRHRLGRDAVRRSGAARGARRGEARLQLRRRARPTMRSAIFLPTPGIACRRATSPAAIALAKLGDRHAREDAEARRGPRPVTVRSRWKSVRSAASAKPKSSSASSRTSV